MNTCPNCFSRLREGSCVHPGCAQSLAYQPITRDYHLGEIIQSMATTTATRLPDTIEGWLSEHEATKGERLMSGAYVAVFDSRNFIQPFMGVGVIEIRPEYPRKLFVRFPGGRLSHKERAELIPINRALFIEHGGIPSRQEG